jgi:hypothetical protein
MMLAETPGFPGAELMAEAIPAKVLSLESILMAVDWLPTDSVKVPVPTCELELANAWDVNVALLARLFTSKEYCPATASELVVAVATVLSATVASKPASWLEVSIPCAAVCKVSIALANEP